MALVDETTAGFNTPDTHKSSLCQQRRYMDDYQGFCQYGGHKLSSGDIGESFSAIILDFNILASKHNSSFS